jgi:hypothetical protein
VRLRAVPLLFVQITSRHILGLISYRILKVARNTANMQSSYINTGSKSPNRLRLATRVMIESGGLYTLRSFLVFLMAIIPSLGLFIVGESVSPFLASVALIHQA